MKPRILTVIVAMALAFVPFSLPPVDAQGTQDEASSPTVSPAIWESGTFQDTVEDQGDHSIKLGWIADNFDDNTNEIWAKSVGSWTFSQGTMALGTGTIVSTMGAWANKTTQFKLTFTAAGSIVHFFRSWGGGYFCLNIYENSDLVVLLENSESLGSFSQSISRNQAYIVKLVAEGNQFEVYWDGVKRLSVTDPHPPTSPVLGQVEFQTIGTTKVKIDDFRIWGKDIGTYTAPAGSAAPLLSAALRTVHTQASANSVDLQIRSSADGVSWGDFHNVRTDARSRSTDATAYSIQDADRRPYYQVRLVLRTRDDSTPSVSQIVVVQGDGAVSENNQVFGVEPWQYYVGGMINPVGGNLVMQFKDMSLPGKGWSMDFTRTLNTRILQTTPMAPGWTHSYNIYLTPITGAVNFTDGDSSTHTFEDVGGGLYASPRGLGGAKLVKNADSTYTMSWKDGSKWSFASSGKISQMQDRNGNKLTFSYDASSRLTTVADDSGLALNLGYDSGGRLAHVGDQTGGEWDQQPQSDSGSWEFGSYGYMSDNLYAKSEVSSATHTYSTFGFDYIFESGDWIQKVQACVEGYTEGDDDVGVRVSTDGGVTWSPEQVIDLWTVGADYPLCLDFTSFKGFWAPADLSDANWRVQIRYVQVGKRAAYNYVDAVLTAVTLPWRFWTYEYNEYNELVKVTDPLGKSEFYEWRGGMGSCFLTRYIDRVGKFTRVGYDLSLRASDVWTGSWNSTTQRANWEFKVYHINYPLWADRWTTRNVTVEDAYGNVTYIEYDALGGRPTHVSGPLAVGGGCPCCGGTSSCSQWDIAWDGENNVVVKTNGRGFSIQLAFDWRGNQVRLTDPLGHSEEYAWLNRDNSTTFDSLMSVFINKRGFLTTYQYDARGNRVRTTDATGNFTLDYYDASGFRVAETSKRGFNTTYGYNVHGWLASEHDPRGHSTGYGYDPLGRMTSLAPSGSDPTTMSYNANNWLTSEVDPFGYSTTYGYNGRGERTSLRDANGNRITYDFNLTWGKIARRTDGSGNVTQYVYDLLGHLTRVRDPNGDDWLYEYDGFGRTAFSTDPSGDVTERRYDSAGNVVVRFDGNGKLTTYEYDPMNQLIQAVYMGQPVNYTYNENGQVLTETGSGYSRVLTYDALERVVRAETNFGTFTKNLQYGYDADGNRVSMTYPDGFTTYYGWSEDDLMVNLTAGGEMWRMVYLTHTLSTLYYPNGLYQDLDYDGLGRLWDTHTYNPYTGQYMDWYRYGYDKMTNREVVEFKANNTWIGYGFNSVYAIASAQEHPGEARTYSYDPNGNRVQLDRSAFPDESYSYDPLYTSQLEERNVSLDASSIRYNYEFDANGNLISTTEFGGAGDVLRYQWDLENRLIGITLNGNPLAMYGYLPDGTRVMETTCSQGECSTRYFLQDYTGQTDTPALLEEYDVTGALLVRYVARPGQAAPLGMLYQGAWYIYHVDGLGSVTMITNSARSVVNRYRYDDFGSIRWKTESVANRFGYAGQEFAATGLIYMHARWYDPAAGRFLSRDPAGLRNGANLYSYVGNNPVSRTDPSGKLARRGEGGGSDASHQCPSSPPYMQCGSIFDWLGNFAGTCANDIASVWFCGGSMAQIRLLEEAVLYGAEIVMDILADEVLCPTLVGCAIAIALWIGGLVSFCNNVNNLCLEYDGV